MENIVIALIGAVTTLALALIRTLSRREKKAGQSTSLWVEQKSLLETLKDTVEIQAEQIKTLKDIIQDQQLQLIRKDEQIAQLTVRVSNLEQLTIEQALVIGHKSDKTELPRTVENDERISS